MKKINENISFETLKGLILRANNDERLQIADEWLRANKAISIQQFQELREVWDGMVRKYGKHEIVISCGSVKMIYAKNLTLAEAIKACKDSRWRIRHNNGCWWDMEIDWQGA